MSRKAVFSLASRDQTEEFAPEIAEMLAVLGMEPEDYLVTDESVLADFSTCYPESATEGDDRGSSWESMRNRWKLWARQEFPRRFPQMFFEEGFLYRPLVVLARRLRESRERKPC